jgi:membrane-associated phospholipid phosphatase
MLHRLLSLCFPVLLLPFLLQAQQTDTTKHITTLDTVPGSKAPLRFSFPQLYVPTALMLTGAASNVLLKNQFKYKIVAERNQHLAHFHTPIDNYTEFAPIAIAYGLDAIGVPSKTDLLNRTVIMAKGEILMYLSAETIKHTIHERRPDGTTLNSFPSGHTAQAFAAAVLLSEEYKDTNPWMPYLAYTIAGGTGVLRMANNRHYVGDVLFGAGLGFLSMKAAYWTHQYKWGKHKVHSKNFNAD